MDHRLRAGRRRSFDAPGHAHELTFCCYRRYPFLAADRTRHWLMKAIDRARDRHGFTLYAYVVMPEHVHLIIQRRDPRVAIAIPAILKAIKQPVGRRALAFLEAEAPAWLPRLTRRRAGRTESLFWQSGGGYDRNLIRAATLHAAVVYIHANPVRRGLVERPGDWPWSSAGWHDGRDPNPLRPDPIPADWSS